MKLTPEIKFELKRMLSVVSFIVFALVIHVLRQPVLGYRSHFFMLWNLFLAIIPYVIACVMLVINNYVKSKWWILILLGVLWLLFFPNAPYLLTSYVHFSWRGFFGGTAFSFPAWYEFLLFTSIIWSGIIAGLVSLEIVHGIAEKYWGKIAGWLMIVIINFLSSWAIYLGRFIRLNSWDVFTDPSLLLPHIILCRDRTIFVFVLGLFLTLMYICINKRANSEMVC